MIAKLEIEQIVVHTGDSGPDRIILYTKLPDGAYPYEGVATFESRVASGGGAAYVKLHFGIDPVVKDFSHPVKRFTEV